MKQLTFLLIPLLLMPIGVEAQDFDSPEEEAMMRTLFKQIYEVRGKVYGADDFEPKPYPLQGANVKVTCVGDTTNMEGDAVKRDGGFNVWITLRERLKDTRLHVTISYIGMKTYDQVITPTKSKENGIDKYTVRLDSIVLQSNPVTLAEAEVVAELKRMYQRGDTTIFNATAYEMPTGSVLLDLVRRMPGLKYMNGKLTYLGRDIKEIRLNGDSFFKRDMSIALNNMPSDKLKSLKVYEVPDDTLDVMTDNHLVMDMETKEKMDRVFMSEGSVGTTEEFNHYLFGGNFSTWKQKGAEIYGSFITQDIPSEGSYQLKSISTNGSLMYGQQLGNTHVDGNGSYSYYHNENKSDSYSKLFMPDYTQVSSNESLNGNKGHSWSGSANLSGSLSKRWRWNGGFSFSKSDNDGHSMSVDSISNEGEGLVSTTRQTNNSHGSSKQVTGNLSFAYQLNEKGDQLNFDYYANHSNDKNTQYNRSYSRFVQLNDSVSDVYHRISTPSNSDTQSFSVNYNNSIGKFSYLRVSYGLHYNHNKSLQSYDDITDDNDFLPVDSLHYDKRSEEIGNTVGMSYFFNNDTLRTNIDVSLTPTHKSIDNDQFGKVEHIKYNGTLFSFNSELKYKLHKNQYGLTYSCSNNLPGVEQLSNVTDYSDPMNISVGNPDLKNEFSHQFGLEFQLKSFMRMTVQYGFSDNSFTTLTLIDRETGVRRTSPANINGNWNTNEYIFLTKPIHDVTLSFTANHSYRHNVSFVQSTTDMTVQKSATKWHNASCDMSVSYGDKYWIINGNVGYSLDYSKSDYLSSATKGHTITADADISYQAPFGLALGTSCSLNKPFGYEMASANKTECIWSLTAEYKFLKKKLASIRLNWRDILNSYNGFHASMSSTTWNESRNYGDSSMFVISFSYRMNDFR